MSDHEHPSPATRAQRVTMRRVFRLTLFVALGVAGYAAFQLVPGWLQFISSRETALLRKQAGLFFVDALLIAYPLAVVLSVTGTAALVYLKMRARTGRQRRNNLASSKSLLRARLLLLCVSTMLSLVLLEAGAALWRARLNASPDLPAVHLPAEPPGLINKGALEGEGPTDPRLPGRFQDQTTSLNGAARPLRILVIGESSATASLTTPGSRSPRLSPGGWRRSFRAARSKSTCGPSAGPSSRRCIRNWPASPIGPTP